MKKFIMFILLTSSLFGAAGTILLLTNKKVELEKSQYCLIDNNIVFKEKGSIVKAIERKELCFNTKEEALSLKDFKEKNEFRDIFFLFSLMSILFLLVYFVVRSESKTL